MKNHINRTDTVLDIMHYMDAPIFENKYEVLTNRVGILIVAENPDDLEDFLNITTCEITPQTEYIKTILKSTPYERTLCIPESSVKQLAEDLVEFLLD